MTTTCKTDSPVIDLATGSTTNIDLDRQSRPVGPMPDLGAYEYSVPTLKAEKPVLYVMTDTTAHHFADRSHLGHYRTHR